MFIYMTLVLQSKLKMHVYSAYCIATVREMQDFSLDTIIKYLILSIPSVQNNMRLDGDFNIHIFHLSAQAKSQTLLMRDQNAEQNRRLKW